jgi:heat shock protein HtpX
VAYFQGDAILMASSGARRIEKEDHPRLFNVVEEMVIASRLPKVPDIYIIDDPAMNAFAAGRKPETSKVAITSGLLAKLDRDQLQGVMAHELAHVVHRDVLFMTLIGVTLGAIVLLSEVFLRSLRHMGGSRYSGGSRGKGNGAQIILVVVAVVLAILAPILAQLIYFAVSRRREYLADAGAAVYTRYPEGLAQALEVLSGQSAKLERVSKATAPMFIVNPLNPSARAAFSMFATHPPSEQRIQVLRGMAGGASFAAYQSAWRKVDRNAKMPATLVAETGAALREASPEALQERAAMQQDNPRDRKRDTGDLLRKLNDFVFIPCACGMRIKLPPTWSEPTAQCPRCGTMHAVPMAGLVAAANVLQQQGIPFRKAKEQATPPPMPSGRTVQKPRDAWATIQCSCGAKKTLSPSFSAPQTLCSNCGKAIDVEIT